MPQDVAAETYYWADIGDNRIGPLIRELIDAMAESDDPHKVRHVARRMRLLASSLESMSSRMAESHDKKGCPICKHGTML